MAIYRCRWGIEQLFKDCKTGGYNLEATQVNDQRFLALVLLIALAYTLATFGTVLLKSEGLQSSGY
jgi:IS4 transposase